MDTEWDEFEDSDDEQDDSDSDPSCFAFHMEDSYAIEILTKAVRGLMVHEDADLEIAAKLRVFLFALERLSLVTPGVFMSVGLSLDMGEESDWIEIRMEEGEFTLGRGCWVDGDADTENVFEVTPGYRECDSFTVTDFAYSFSECAEDVCREFDRRGLLV